MSKLSAYERLVPLHDSSHTVCQIRTCNKPPTVACCCGLDVCLQHHTYHVEQLNWWQWYNAYRSHGYETWEAVERATAKVGGERNANGAVA